ncbi:hypothetical protein K2Z83_24320 [Oscillochloris sp. ZM17-4]|uniref:hypothetical protein n=1 Tax=Oscillochloris sp. ZM17-4 TaxID=2866714 RepID=UPI001C738336|nr:hypothetical protein [Oscillochloris sp. ZM17-4]MBX0330787.1 hypothetical protein [Oscillochloris sp. ZM17-4]
MSNTERDGLFGIGASLVSGTIRLSLTAASAPLIILPGETRRRVRRAMAEGARAIIAIPQEISNVSERVVDDIFSGAEPTLNLPSTEQIGERARAFTERLARAADEFGTSVGRIAGRAADGAERTAARVDEWIEKPATPTK